MQIGDYIYMGHDQGILFGTYLKHYTDGRIVYLWLCMHVALQFALLCEHAFNLASPSKSCVDIGVYSNQSILFGT